MKVRPQPEPLARVNAADHASMREETSRERRKKRKWEKCEIWSWE